MDFWIKAAQLLLSLSILVVLHEFGHFIPARIFKTRVEKFYLFFNYKFSLFKKKIGETEWGIGWIPLGGYVKIAGMIDESMDKEQMAKPPQPWEFRSKPAWQRLIIMIGGVVVNLIVGVLIYIFVIFGYGEEMAPAKDLKLGMAIHPYMEQYDIHSGDNILAVDGEEVMHPSDIARKLVLRGGRELTVQRPDGAIEKIEMPEDIDYKLFEEGATGIASLRKEISKIERVHALFNTKSKLFQAGDIILEIDDQPLSAFNFYDEEFRSKSHDISIARLVKREIDTMTIEATPEELLSLFRVAPALVAGFCPGDEIVKVNDEEITYFDQVTTQVYKTKGQNVKFTLRRDGKEFDVYPYAYKKTGTVGFAVEESKSTDNAAITTKYYSFGESISEGTSTGYWTLADYASQLKFLFTKKGASSIGGFGTIGSLFPPTWNWQIFWLNTAFISIVLAFMNILPIPALDGGHVVFLIYEMITGKEAPQKVLEYAQYVGFFIIMGLLLYANGNDLYRWLLGG